MLKIIAKKFSLNLNKRNYRSVKWTRFPFKYENPSNNQTKITTLPTGLRVVTHKIPGHMSTVGFFIDSGSRAENVLNNGVAHFFEHMAFKGSTKMSQHEMESYVENIGTRLFAYTSRETTVYYGKCFTEDGPKIVEILSDIIQRPLLSPNAIERERSVILRETEDIETQMHEVIFDHLHSTAYQGCPLGFTILGPTENINRINRDDLESYIKKHYTANRIVLIAVGDVDHEEYVNLAKKHLMEIPSDTSGKKWYEPSRYLGSSVQIRNDDMPLAHVAVSYEAPPPTHPDFMPLMLASTYLGSWDQTCTNGKVMPSHLAQYVSEEDVMRSYMSFYATYKDTALWGIYFTAKRTLLRDVDSIIGNQLNILQSKLTEGSVIQAKNALKASYLMQVDGTTPLFEEIGRQILTYGRAITQEEFEQEIDLCTSETVENAVRNMIYGRCIALSAIGPIEALPEYITFRRMGRSFLS